MLVRIGNDLTLGTLDPGTQKDIESSSHLTFSFSPSALCFSSQVYFSVFSLIFLLFLIRLSTSMQVPLALLPSSSVMPEPDGKRLDYLNLCHLLGIIIPG